VRLLGRFRALVDEPADLIEAIDQLIGSLAAGRRRHVP
jgi:hypothetical protein